MKEGDHSRTNLAHSADCRARVAEILADDIAFRTKMRKAVERKEGARRTMEPFPKVPVGGSTSSGCAPVGLTAHPSPQSDDVVMDSADIEIPLSSPANAPIPPPISVTGTKRSRDDEDLEDEQVAKVPAITSVGLKRGRSDSSSSSSSSSSSTSEQEDQKIDREGDAVMHMNTFPEQHLTKEYKSSISTKAGKRDVHEKDRRDQSVCDVVEIFSPPRVCRRARSRGLRGGWSLDDSATCPVTGKTWDLLNSQEQKRAWNFFYKAKPKLLAASPPLLVLAKVEMAVNMCLAQHEAGRKFVFEHQASASLWNFASLRRLAEISGIYSCDSDLVKINTNSETIDELIDKRCCVDRELDLCDAFIDGMLMEEIHGKREVRSDLTSDEGCSPKFWV